MTEIFNFNLRLLKTCPHCDGAKIIQHAYWTEYFEELDRFKSGNNLMFSDLNCNEAEDNFSKYFWAKKGYGEDFLLDHPPEEIACPHCKGTGLISERNHIKLDEKQVLYLISGYYAQLAEDKLTRFY